VACPSLLLPRRRDSLREPDAWARSDAWDGYPASLSKLLALLHRVQARRTLFVSGDEHHALACRITLRDGHQDRDLVLWSIHASALYAPLPFANGQPTDLTDEPFDTDGDLQVSMRTWNAPEGDGYARLSLSPNEPDEAQLEWVKADGRRKPLRLDLIDPEGCPGEP
jgi:cholesterol oxidase